MRGVSCLCSSLVRLTTFHALHERAWPGGPQFLRCAMMMASLQDSAKLEQPGVHCLHCIHARMIALQHVLETAVYIIAGCLLLTPDRICMATQRLPYSWVQNWVPLTKLTKICHLLGKSVVNVSMHFGCRCWSVQHGCNRTANNKRQHVTKQLSSMPMPQQTFSTVAASVVALMGRSSGSITILGYHAVACCRCCMHIIRLEVQSSPEPLACECTHVQLQQ